MRIAVFSDIHGNDLAFEAVEADIKKQNVDQLVCLGDAIQGGPQPRQTVERLRALNCPIVLGNADAWMLTGIETADDGIPEDRLKKMGEIRLWSLSQLTEDDREFIANFQATVTLQPPDQLELLCFHGSPTSFDDVMTPDAPQEVFEKFLGTYADKILTGGHTHAQQIRNIGNHFFFNPGSVGRVPWYDQVTGNIKQQPWAEYAILNAYKGQISLEFRRIPYDINELINIYRTSGRPFADEAIAEYQR